MGMKRPKLSWKDKWCILKEATRLYGASWGGAEKAKNALQRMYMARASNYTDALKNYVESYKEGLKEHLEEEAMAVMVGIVYESRRGQRSAEAGASRFAGQLQSGDIFSLD
uniref:Uncharacterized protein n=1 Tax=Oryza sativa subsp. japonica TaxID=39947 RepID=Q6YZP4_ORYSJ|nr:hypothetical protein [Oryza sativa Japonica Group]BAD03740.1 hypothetical protein [Oryza sativa Japonica Group]